MTLTEAPLTSVGDEQQQVTTEDVVIARLREDIMALQQQQRRRHLFHGNGFCSRKIVILPEGVSSKEFKGYIISHLRGTFTLDDSILRQAMAKLRQDQNLYHLHPVEYGHYSVHEDKNSYLVYQVDLLESVDSR